MAPLTLDQLVPSFRRICWGWTRSRTPLIPAPKRLRDLLKDRKP